VPSESLRPPRDAHAHEPSLAPAEPRTVSTRDGESRVAHSMSPRRFMTKTRSAASRHLARIGTWTIWTQPGRVQVFVLLSEALVVALAIRDLWHATIPSPQIWSQFTMLLVASHIYQRLTRNQEERRRAHTGSTRPHGDFTSIFFFPAAILLPAWLAIILIVTIRWARFAIARQPPFRFIMTTASVIAAATTAHYLVNCTHWHQAAGETWQAELHTLTLALVGAGYVTQQVLVVAVLKRLSAPSEEPLTRLQLFGSREYLTDLCTAMGLAVLLTMADASLLATLAITLLAIKIHIFVADREVGRRDGGTGLATKARWIELANRALLDAPTQGRTPGLLIIDLDHFKKVNDTYHHLVGDMLLQEVANQLAKSVRPEDLVGRFGGEEFVILLHRGDNAYAIAERIRKRIQNIDLVFTNPYGGEPAILSNRTASIGIAIMDTSDATLSSLLKVADAALYRAKADGRNRVVGPWSAISSDSPEKLDRSPTK